MTTPASIGKHPIHPMLIPFPIALWVVSLICDLVYTLGLGGGLWKDLGFYSMAGGVIGAVMAAIPGYLDYRSLVAPPVQRLGRWHMMINLSIVILFAINLWLRMDDTTPSSVTLVLSFIGVGMLGISGWLGGELVYVHGVAVEPQTSGAVGIKERSRAA